MTLTPTLVTGTLRLARLHVRTHHKSLLLWAIVMSGVVVAVARSITALYPTTQDRIAYATTASVSSGAVAFNGRWSDLTTLGGITTNEVGFMGLLLFPTVATLLAIRLTRGEEDAGRTELLTARRVGRLAPLLAAVLVVALDLVLFGFLAAAGTVAVGLPLGGSIRYAVSLVLFALAFAGLGFLAAEVSREARTATGLGIGIVLGLFLVRAVIDGADWSASWVTPSGWLPQVRAFASEGSRWWPYAAYVVTFAVMLGAAGAVTVRRDLYGGVVAARPGRARARAWCTRPVGMAWRLTRGPFLGWLLALVVWGGSLGALAKEMTEAISASPQLLELYGVDRPEDFIAAMSLALAAIGASALLLHGVGRLAGEEDSGRLGLLASGRYARWRLWSAWVVVLGLEALVVLAAQGAALGAATAWATGRPGNVASSLEGAAVTMPAVLLVGAVALAVRAVMPPVAPAAWALVGWVAVVGFLADALDLPTWARRLSPVDAVGRVPIEDPRLGTLVAFSVAAGVLALVGAVAFARRDLRAG